MTDATELLDLAAMLEKKAKLADARAALHAHHGRKEDQAKELDNADYCRRKAEVCRRIANRKKVSPNAADKAEWFCYAAAIGWRGEDVAALFDHYEANGWKVSGKTPMKDWKAACRNGYRRWLEKHPKAKRKTAEKAPVPVTFGFEDWCKSEFGKSVTWEDAPDSIRAEFQRRNKL